MPVETQSKSSSPSNSVRRTTLLAAFAVASSVVAPRASSVARAEIPAAPQVADTEAVVGPPSVWYGFQTLAPAVTAAALAAGGAWLCHSSTCEGVTLGTAATLFALGGGAVHLAHRNPRAAGIGLAAKLVLPLIGYGLGRALDSCDPRQSYLCSEDGEAGVPVFTFLGVLGGVILAGAIDVGMSTEPAVAPGRSQKANQNKSAQVTPFVVLHADRAGVGLLGRF